MKSTTPIGVIHVKKSVQKVHSMLAKHALSTLLNVDVLERFRMIFFRCLGIFSIYKPVKRIHTVIFLGAYTDANIMESDKFDV